MGKAEKALKVRNEHRCVECGDNRVMHKGGGFFECFMCGARWHGSQEKYREECHDQKA